MSQVASLEHLWLGSSNADISLFISCAATTLVLYEHLITLRLEVQQIWKRAPSMATLLFVTTRYFLFLECVFALVGLYPIRNIGYMLRCFSCSVVLWLHAVTSSALVIVMSAIAAIRVYALWDRNLHLLLVVMLTGLFPAFANLFFRSASTPYIIPTKFYSCQCAPTAMTALTYKSLSIATRVIAIVSDGLVVIVTWIKTYRIYTLTKRIGLRTGYSVLIMRDAICVLNLVAIMYIVSMLEDMPFSWDDSGGSKLTSSKPFSSVRFASRTFDTMGGTVRMGDDGNTMEMEEEHEQDTMDGHAVDISQLTKSIRSVDDLHEVHIVESDAVTWA
ncbi:hypothetical protein BD414DRAFT_497671 [Trametes punicea]|nr:hypothetical protein BD414DRAFT_497671 [Trametes punicea]